MMNRGIIWLFGYFGVCCIVLIPSPLIEPRYFIIPFVFFILNCKITLKKTIWIQIFVFFFINIFIIGMFLYRPFFNNDERQRRIW